MLDYVKEVAPDVILGLWRIDQEVSPVDYPQEVAATLPSLCPRRQHEVAATYALLRVMTDTDDTVVHHDPSGKPTTERWHISISHTKSFVAVILSRSHHVAVDVEYVSPRINNIAHKFLRPDENAPDLLSRLVHWCTKETLYKLFSEQHLALDEMRIQPFTLHKLGTVEAETTKTTKKIQVHYECHKEYVLTWVYLCL